MFMSKNERYMSQVILYNRLHTGGILLLNSNNDIVYLGSTVEGADLYVQMNCINTEGISVYMYHSPDLIELKYLHDRGITDIYYYNNVFDSDVLDYMDNYDIFTVHVTSGKLRHLGEWRL